MRLKPTNLQIIDLICDVQLRDLVGGILTKLNRLMVWIDPTKGPVVKRRFKRRF